MLYTPGAVAYSPNHAVDGPASPTAPPLVCMAKSGRGAAVTAPGLADTKKARADMTKLLPRLSASLGAPIPVPPVCRSAVAWSTRRAGR